MEKTTKKIQTRKFRFSISHLIKPKPRRDEFFFCCFVLCWFNDFVTRKKNQMNHLIVCHMAMSPLTSSADFSGLLASSTKTNFFLFQKII